MDQNEIEALKKDAKKLRKQREKSKIRSRQYESEMKAKGYKKIAIWVPKGSENKFKSLAEQERKKFNNKKK